MDYHFCLEDDLTLTPAGEFDYITQNSVGTKKFFFAPNGWAPAEGETLAVVFEYGAEGAEQYFDTGAIQLGKTSEKNEYFTVIPDEVVRVRGVWKMSIYKRLNFDDGTGISERDTVGEPYAFTIVATIRDSNGEVITRYDLANMAQFQRDLESGFYAARGFYPWQKGFVYREGEIAFFAEIAGREFGAFVRSLASENADPPYDGDGRLNENWEEVLNLNTVTDDFFEKLKTLEEHADARAKAAEDAADTATKAAEEATNAAANIADVKDRAVHYVQTLPALQNAEEGGLYAVIQDTDSNIFDLYMLQNGVWTWLGSERLLANGWKRYDVILGSKAWREKRQTIFLYLWTKGWTVDTVFPSDESALSYLKYGIRFESGEGGALTFTCDTVPEENVTVIVDVRVEYTVPTLSDYYTAPETDAAIDRKIKALVDDADEAYDTFKEVAEYIKQDKSGAAALLKRVETNAENIAAEREARIEEAAKKQDAETDELNTADKTVVGAINAHEKFLVRVREEVPSTHTVTVEIGHDDWHGRTCSFYAIDYPDLAEIGLDSGVTCIVAQACAVLALSHGIKLQSYSEGSVTFSCETVPEETYSATIIIKNNL